ncbi:hypothetical protein AB4Z09_20870 [Rhodococcus sp. TAF43]|uniref:hypothetical protein n=1 Tax=unclassified Rhodococcus (in: high G+C Gram-positive bacteria) TaxID=192944 RepID=UPI000E0A46FD|nr:MULTISPECIES: hypothetical protein [unclassified Rhodococcus (in: high G+C Gram-positive bacteria)]QKT10608.1 hypothetical protein HUN07_07630 [Rhodococcus sp. W8901]
MIDAQTLENPAAASVPNPQPVRRWTPGSCVWCGSAESIEVFRNEPRCEVCREHETVIDEARKFMGMYGLRPIGGTLQSDDDEEREWRVNARDARAALNQIRLPEPPDPALIRKSMRPKAARIVTAFEAESAPARKAPARPRTASSAPAPAPTAAVAPAKKLDVAALEERVTGLLDQLTKVDTQIGLAEAAQGLAARARLNDLNSQKATILRTLAALEKARRSAGE